MLSSLAMTQDPSAPLPHEEPKVGSMIVGAKLSWNEYAMAWGTVAILTLGNLLGDVGNFVLAYFFTQVCLPHSISNHSVITLFTCHYCLVRLLAFASFRSGIKYRGQTCIPAALWDIVVLPVLEVFYLFGGPDEQ